MTAETTSVATRRERRWTWVRPRLSIGTVGALIVGFMAIVAIFAPSIAPFRHTELVGQPLQPPDGILRLGTDGLGRDVFSQLVLGARVSLTIAAVAGVATLCIGATVGMLAGWVGGRLDMLLMRVVDIVMAIPWLSLLILVGAYLGPNVLTIALIISVTSWPPGARVVRSQVLSLRGRTHLRAAIGFGGGTWHVLRRHIVPELGLILVAGLIGAAGRAVMVEAGLAFLGLGDPTQSSWGQMLRSALDYSGVFFTDAWKWWLVPPIVAISALLMGLTFLGMAVEERINPRLRRHRSAKDQ